MNLYCPYCKKQYEGCDGILSCSFGYKNFHVLQPKFSLSNIKLPTPFAFNIKANPFLLFKNLLYSYHLLKKYKSEIKYHEILCQIESGLKNLGESGLSCTPVLAGENIGEKVGLPKHSLFVKIDAANITGSHKIRHAIGNILYLEAVRILNGEKRKKDLAIYSCGNAALGAAAVASSLGYKLFCFVPEDVDEKILKRLIFYQARVIRVKRENIGMGDPCYNRFQESIKTLGFIPFSCSGPDNWSNIEGGATLFYEMAMQMRYKYNTDLDTIIIQVGGGALASSVIYASSMLQKLKFMKKKPKIICVQTESCYPLKVAFDKLKKYRKRNSHLSISILMRKIGQKGGHFMSAWSKNIPKSLAEGILDDTTYDFLAIIEGLFKTNGQVVVVDEKEISSAYKLAESLGFNVSATGTAGLAGLLKLLKEGKIHRRERIGILFTGIAKRKNIEVNPENIEKNTFLLSKKDSIEKILN